MSSPWMFDLISQPLSDLNLDIRKITLVCDKTKYIERMKLDCRREEQVNLPDSMDEYYNLVIKKH